jgi:HSP20 family molecular chaperone IbpA
MLPLLSDRARDFPSLFSLLDDMSCTKPVSNLPFKYKLEDDMLEINVVVPGISKKEIEVSIEDRVLTLSVNKEDFWYGKCYKKLTLPKDFDYENVNVNIPSLSSALTFS